MFLVYKYTNTVSGKEYIGYTKTTIEKRWKSHCYRAKYYQYNRKFDNALCEYTENFWVHEILIDNIPSLEEAKQKEIEMISLYDTYKNGYNSNPGGGGYIITEEIRNKLTGPKSEEFKEKISKSLQGNKRHLGKKHSEETRKKMSLSAMGNKNRLGKINSIESNFKNSKSNKGKIPWNKGKKITKEVA
jgi:group I intron endonuclease